MTTMGVNMDAFNRAGLNNINSGGDEYGGDEYDDNEYDNSDADDEYDNSDADDDVTYEPEEPSKTRYNIVLCDLHNPTIHGIHPESDVGTHYLVHSRFKQFNLEIINANVTTLTRMYLRSFSRQHGRPVRHPIYKNYDHIVSKANYIKPEIAECIYLETQECVAILKTFWIRLIQRSWRNVLLRRKRIIQKRSSIQCLNVRQITGKWPAECASYPGLAGMLARIK
jgi:hypothetical protein